MVGKYDSFYNENTKSERKRDTEKYMIKLKYICKKSHSMLVLKIIALKKFQKFRNKKNSFERVNNH